jgi:hypothetical protein
MFSLDAFIIRGHEKVIGTVSCVRRRARKSNNATSGDA